MFWAVNSSSIKEVAIEAANQYPQTLEEDAQLIMEDDQKRMLGDAQFAWLLDGLRNSKARFKMIVSGSTLNHSKVDGWRIYTFSRHRLFDALKKHQISGVMYMSGDIHSSLVWEHHESDRIGYPLVEVISSGVANSRTLSFATVDFDTCLLYTSPSPRDKRQSRMPSSA